MNSPHEATGLHGLLSKVGREYGSRYVLMGEVLVARKPHLISTVLGSCVSVCLWDPASRVGGMNHYAAPRCGSDESPSNRFGDVSIRSLVEKMLELGCEPAKLTARIYGGSRMLSQDNGFFSVGPDNIKVAREMLEDYGIPVINANTGGRNGRKVIFDTFTGRVSITHGRGKAAFSLE